MTLSISPSYEGPLKAFSKVKLYLVYPVPNTLYVWQKTTLLNKLGLPTELQAVKTKEESLTEDDQFRDSQESGRGDQSISMSAVSTSVSSLAPSDRGNFFILLRKSHVQRARTPAVCLKLVRKSQLNFVNDVSYHSAASAIASPASLHSSGETSSIFGALTPSAGLRSTEGRPRDRKLTPRQAQEAKEGGLGSRWPRGMWDNMDSELSCICSFAPPMFVLPHLLYCRERPLEDDHGPV